MDHVTCIFVRICVVLFLYNACKCLMFKRLYLCVPATVFCPHLPCCNTKLALELLKHMLIFRCNTIWPTLRQKHVCWMWIWGIDQTCKVVLLAVSHFQGTERCFAHVQTVGCDATVSLRGTWKAVNCGYMHGVTCPSVLIRCICCVMYTLGITLSWFVKGEVVITKWGTSVMSTYYYWCFESRIANLFRNVMKNTVLLF
jgi:hypothetical protein